MQTWWRSLDVYAEFIHCPDCYRGMNCLPNYPTFYWHYVRSMQQSWTLSLVVLSLFLSKLTFSVTHICITWGHLIILRRNILLLTVSLPRSSGMIPRKFSLSLYWSTADSSPVLGYLIRRSRNKRRVSIISWQVWIQGAFISFCGISSIALASL